MKKNIPKILFVLFAIILIVIAAYYIYSNNNNSQNNTVMPEVTPEIFTSLRLGIAEFDTINPIMSNNKNVQEISKLIYEPLVTFDKDYKLKDCLAKEWSKINNNSYIIKLKEDIKWSDNTEFTANDVKFTILKIQDESISSIYRSNLKNIIGVEIIDKYTVKLVLNSDIPFFEYNLTFPILSEQFYLNEDFKQTTKNNNPVGTGRYKISSNQNNEIILEQNSYYRDKVTEEEKYTIKTINIYLYSSMGEVYNAFKIGNIDLVTTSNLYVEQYIGTIGYNRKDYKGREYELLALNTKSEILSNAEIRKAISYSIDRNSINEQVYNTKFYVSDFPLDYNNWLYKQDSVSSGYNPEKVQNMLIENGWELKNSVWQKNGQVANLNLIVNSANTERCKVAENVRMQLSNIGIQITIKEVSTDRYQEYLKSKDYDIILCGTRIGFSPDLTTYFGESNFSNYNNEEINSILYDVLNITNEEILKEKYIKLYEVYKLDMPFISLYFNRNTVCYSTNLMGDISPNCYNVFYNIEKWYRQY